MLIALLLTELAAPNIGTLNRYHAQFKTHVNDSMT